jgi:hypothetical protein
MIQTFKAPALRCRPTRAMTADTGTHCPVSGRWSPDGELPHSQVFFEGSLMPPFEGAPVVWVLGPDPAGY